MHSFKTLHKKECYIFNYLSKLKKHNTCMRYLLITLISLQACLLVAQNKEDINLLDTDTTWRKETLFFPFPFARDIDLEGQIDVRFSKGWSDQESPLFWSYAFGWDITRKEKFTEAEIEEIMVKYLGGLMKVVNRDKDFIVPETIALFTEVPNNKDMISYRGKIRMHDSFFSKKIVVLNVIGKYHFCKQDGRAKLLFKLSPQDLDHEAWEYLNQAKFQADVCK